MALVNFTGFESGDTFEEATSGSVSVVSTPVKTGGYSGRANPTTTAAAYFQFRKFDTAGLDASLNLTVCRLSFDFRFATKPSSGDEVIFDLHDGTNVKFEVRIDSSGHLVVYDSALAVDGTGTTVLSADTWYRITMTSANGATASYTLSINGVSEVTGTMDVLTGNYNRARLGKATNRNGNTVDFFYDNVFLDDTSLVDDAAVVEAMQPNADGTYTAWTIGAGSGADWEQVDEVPNDSATSYLLSTLASGDASSVGLESAAAAGISGTILSAKYFGTFRRDGASTGAILARIRSGSTNADSASSGPAGSVVARNILYNTDPADSAAWTTGDLDAVEIGVVENHVTNKTRWVNGQLMVAFVPSAGGGVTVSPAVQVLTFTIAAIAIAAGALFAAPVQSLAFSMPTPTVTAIQNVSVAPVAQALTFSLPTPGITGGASVAPDTQVLTFSIPAPTVDVAGSVTVAPAVQVLTFSIPSPTVTAIQNVSVAPAVQMITASLPASTASGGSTTAPGTQSLTFSLPSPVAAGGAGHTANVQVLTFSTPAPTVSAVQDVTVSVNVQVLTFSIPAVVFGDWVEIPRDTDNTYTEVARSTDDTYSEVTRSSDDDWTLINRSS